MKIEVCKDEYKAMIQALANKFKVDHGAIESLPEVIKIKERCQEMDEHIDFLIKGEGEL